MRTSSLISAALGCVALFFSTGDARLDGSSNVPQYVSDHGEGSLLISHTWKSKAKLPRRMSDMTATTYGDAVYLVGGCAQDQGYMEFSGDNSTWGYYVCNEITTNTTAYFPSNDSYVVLPEAPHARYRHAAAAVGKYIYVFGGCDVNDNIVTAVDAFDVTTGVWKTLSQSFTGATSDNAGFVLDGPTHAEIYSVGGYARPWGANETKAKTWVLKVDKTTGDWDTSTQWWSEAGSLTEKRGDLGVVVAGGKAIAYGGFTHVNQYTMPLATVEIYDSKSNTWTSTTSLAQPRGDKAGAAVNGRVFVVGGETRGSNGEVLPLTDVEVFNPLSKAWTKAGDIPTPRFRFTAASVGSDLFVFGGQGYLVGTANTVGSYYPVVDTVERFEETVTIVPTIEIGLNLLYIGIGIVGVAVGVCAASAVFQKQLPPKSSDASSGADVAQKL